MALTVGTKVVLTEDTDPEPEVGTVLADMGDGQFKVRWPKGWMIEMDHHHTMLAEVGAVIDRG